MPNSTEAVLADATGQLEAASIPTARLDATLLLAHVLGRSREHVLASTDNILNDNNISSFRALVARRGKHEPIAYITGIKEFWSLDFCVTRDTLIPRPETETLIEAALKRVRSHTKQGQAKPITLLDIGTGSGCLLVSLLKEFPNAQGVGVDKSERALQVARENAKRHNVDSRAQLVHSHWCDAIDGTFDLIVSNPPYIAEGAMNALMPDVVQYEPHTALVAGTDGLDAYRALAPSLPLNAGGYVLFEVGAGQARDVEALLRAQGLNIETAEKDLAGIERCVIARNSRGHAEEFYTTTPQG